MAENALVPAGFDVIAAWRDTSGAATIPAPLAISQEEAPSQR
jgi:hypothetical protein